MKPLWCGVAWALAVMGGALRFRPPPARVRALRRGARRPSSGRHRARPAKPVLTGGAAVVALFLWPPLVIGVLGAAALVPRWRRARAHRARHASVVDGLPEVIDLIALAVGAGLTVPLIIRALARRAPPPFGPAFAATLNRAEHGHRLADAMAALPPDLGEEVRPLTAALVATERYGVPLAPALEHLAHDARRERRRRADAAARRLPVRLCFPLVCCTLPAFGLLTIAPLLAGALRSLRL